MAPSQSSDSELGSWFPSINEYELLQKLKKLLNWTFNVLDLVEIVNKKMPKIFSFKNLFHWRNKSEPANKCLDSAPCRVTVG